MKAFEWQDEYSIGDATIDAQHRKLIDILNRLHDLLNDETLDQASAEAGKVFDQLADYVMTHFAYEEQVMADAGYPVDKVVEHKWQHDTLLAKVQEVMHAYQDGNTKALAELLPFLYGDWLIDHICHSDKAYSSYL